jgi:hypothetical protein
VNCVVVIVILEYCSFSFSCINDSNTPYSPPPSSSPSIIYLSSVSYIFLLFFFLSSSCSFALLPTLPLCSSSFHLPYLMFAPTTSPHLSLLFTRFFSFSLCFFSQHLPLLSLSFLLFLCLKAAHESIRGIQISSGRRAGGHR